jgi:adenine-specific DNA-methyltransferase
MNFIASESLQKLRGGFYTDPDIASFLVNWIKVGHPESILEPSCGDGIFLKAIQEQRIQSLKQIIAFEIEPIEAEKAQARTDLTVNVINKDFLRWFLFDGQFNNYFDAVVGNPPFIRYQYLSEEQQFLAEKIFKLFSLPFTKHTNAWVPFVLASIKLLRPGGRLSMVIPSEIFHIPHAASLRQYLTSQCSRILIIDPQEIWFQNTLQGTVLLLAEKKQNDFDICKGVSVIPIVDKNALSINPEQLFQEASYTDGLSIVGKWMTVFLSPYERSLLAQLKDTPKIKQFSDIASVDVGIVTGANKFFLVPDKIVKEYSLQEWAHPMFGRSDHVQGLIFTNEDHIENNSIGLPSNFLWFQEENINNLPHNVKQYLQFGVNQQLPERYKCRTRTCWYKVPSVYASPVAMLKRANNYPRLILNKANAYSTDTAYRIQPIKILPTDLVFGFVNSLTCLMAELEGRHYGGGVLELVPSEIERLLIPLINVKDSDLFNADQRFREINNDIAFIQEQDQIVLGAIGLSKNEQILIFEAWLRLRNRRHRIPNVESILE